MESAIARLTMFPAKVNQRISFRRGAKLPAETQERRYYDRLIQAYPIHPEVFDRHGCPEDSPARYGLPIKTKAPLVMKNDN
jgi:hypothetical protein